MTYEKWKDIEGYEGLYQISNLGRIRSFYNYRRDGTNILKPRLKRGYYQVGLRKNGERKWHHLHRLVAKAFIPNPNNLPQINHKDENKTNNVIDNLEWCSVSYNNCYGTRRERVKEKTGKKVLQYDKEMNLIKEYPSIADATKEMGLKSISSICNCCRGVTETSKNYIWKYKSEVM